MYVCMYVCVYIYIYIYIYMSKKKFKKIKTCFTLKVINQDTKRATQQTVGSSFVLFLTLEL